MMEKILSLVLGSKYERDLKKLVPVLHKVNSFEKWAMSIPEQDFPVQTSVLKDRLARGETLDDLLPEAFALAREAARRILGERPYDVQIVGGIVLHQGKINEMKTGEGKTLACVSAAYLNALAGKGVHVITVNDYLAERDSKWMGRVFNYLGLSVGVILSNMDPETRQKEYAKDITYGTNNEFGFDYLRDNMRWDFGLKAQKRHFYCIIDEIDSILIDEARTPLIISGSVEEDTSRYTAADQIVPALTECEKDPNTGDYPLEDPLSGASQPKGDYKLDEKNKRVTFTDEGMNHIEELLHRKKLIEGSLFDEENFEYLHYVTQAMRSHKLFHRDVDYVVQEGEVQIVDEFTGRILHGRRYSDGLHQAIEAKEKIKVAQRNRTLATITFQNYFRMYDKISGMTGTADTEAHEFAKIYNLEVVVVPTNRPVRRLDDNDVIYLNEDYKFDAICDRIEEIHATGQPILVGTISVDKSEKLARNLQKRRIPHEILNAKNHHREALIIAEAGAKGAVTIATNMAGRGTDIKLGGNPESRAMRRAGTDAEPAVYEKVLREETEKWRREHDEVLELGGLYVIGSERHESRRIDNQLRGRSGRQGDPGYSQFFISLDDDLMRLFGGENFKQMMSRFGMKGPEPLFHPLINRSLERAQKRVEERNYEIRKHLLEYDDVLNKQRTHIYSLRDEVLTEEDLSAKILGTGREMLGLLLNDFQRDTKDLGDAVSRPKLLERLKQNFSWVPAEGDKDSLSDAEGIRQVVDLWLERDINEKKDLIGADRLNQIIRFEYLRLMDERWQDHLESMEALREAVYLRSYAQKNPLIEYKNEGFEIFDQMVEEIEIAVSRKIFRVRIRKEGPVIGGRRPDPGARAQASHQALQSFSARGGKAPGPRSEADPRAMQIRRTEPKVGRNDPCPCGSGKKYKHCCGGT